MKIQCPHCSNDNDIELAEKIQCLRCDKNFVGFSFRKYNRLAMGVGSAIIMTSVVNHTIDFTFFEAKRYSTAAIYEIVGHCANPPGVSLSKARQQKLALTCICALDKTMSHISERELKNRASQFNNLFIKYVETCR